MAVLSQLSRSRLASKNATFESRWRLFALYCASRLRDPLFASPALVADFLLHAAESREASYSTLVGYRSATWLPLPILTAKTVFLLALSYGERRHALAALSFPPSFAESSVILPFNEEYIPKSYYLRRNLSRIGPLSIPVCPNPQLQQVCPVCTLRFYLDAVASHRAPSQTSFIIPHDLTSFSNLSIHSVGRYVVRLVRFCYAVDGAVTVMTSARSWRLCAHLPLFL